MLVTYVRIPKWLPVLAGVLVLSVLVQAREDTARGSNLQLRLEARDVPAGVPEKFVFVLVNRGRHDVVVPKPTVECADLFNGTVRIQLDFTPLHPSPESEGMGRGCPTGRSDWPPILDRIKGWKTPRPGESLSIDATQQDLLVDGRAPGRYEFRARYKPPEISPYDQDILRKTGIDFPHGPLTSERLVFQRK
jgi:hypothetical protein